ncbi:hypothetical protein L1049_017797 [Liquidambar formosana]|uniref:non-specific serine/threonine protein kinase n=1 Tax=Liquidambar formosana TaxID=63359 RepID=A0AAP0N360_LIQFO
MRTAVTTLNGSNSLDLYWEPESPTSQYYIYMYFAELEELRANQSREFNISLNGRVWYGQLVPDYLYTTTIYSVSPEIAENFKVSIYKTENSTLPPIINAIEIYMVKQLLQPQTDQEDVDAMINIKSTYGVKRNWQGDPCAPKAYLWDGVNCSYVGYDPPRIISLDLSSSGLTGEISPYIANLKLIQILDLSNNNLTGPVPDFLMQLPVLRILNLMGNNLTGSVPMGLIERSKNGSLSLSVGENPNLCLTVTCGKTKKKNLVVPVVTSVAAFILLTALAFLWRLKWKNQVGKVAKVAPQSNDREVTLETMNRHFTYSMILSITNNFERVLGKGGFGTVYHGYLDDTTQVAVKMLTPSSIQGYKKFHTEAELLTRVHHQNLTSLVGYCDEADNMGLIYEYMSNGNLEGHLSDKNQTVMDWEVRLRIAVDTAQVEDGTHVSTVVLGTPGYLDPEYYVSNELNEKSDVFSFGVVLLEMITSRPALEKNIDKPDIIQWVNFMLATKGDARTVVDPRLHRDYDINSVWKALEVALDCVSPTSIERPNMNDVVMNLKQCLATEMARVKEGNEIERFNRFGSFES